ncbi:hypothetical protein PC113_g24704 [Phytophthora cactorum]|uniref:Uncharacterized protein n=1 Tax=Phytophthora cactorum TaxID=29920 RepID=A0A8T0Y9E7_9STRA|nr:hypothetical protein PC113_g24704 [Phytophthora cactorum]
MRFFWPIRERALSSDSEASTASQSSLASDASFYSAADEAGSDWSDFRPISDEAEVGFTLLPPFRLQLRPKMGLWTPHAPCRCSALAATRRPQLRARVQDTQRPLRAKRTRGQRPLAPKPRPALRAHCRVVSRRRGSQRIPRAIPRA